jgi:hypothetical protein
VIARVTPTSNSSIAIRTRPSRSGGSLYLGSLGQLIQYGGGSSASSRC